MTPRIARIAACLLVVALSLYPLHAQGSARKAPVTLKFALYIWPGAQPLMAKIVAQFEKQYPSIHVQTTWLSGSTYWQKIQTEAVAGQPPDVFLDDPDLGDTFTVYAAWDDGSATQTLAYPVYTTQLNLAHTLPSNLVPLVGTHTIDIYAQTTVGPPLRRPGHDAGLQREHVQGRGHPGSQRLVDVGRRAQGGHEADQEGRLRQDHPVRVGAAAECYR